MTKWPGTIVDGSWAVVVAGHINRAVRRHPLVKRDIGGTIGTLLRRRNQPRESIEIDRLRQVCIEACRLRLLLVALSAPPRRCHEKYVLAPGLATDTPGDFIPVHAGHSNVQQRYVRWMRLHLLKCVDAVDSRFNIVALHPEQESDRVKRVDIVVRRDYPLELRSNRFRFNLLRNMITRCIAVGDAKSQGESTTLFRAFAVCLDGAAVQFHDRVRERETDAQPSGSIAGCIFHLGKHFKNARELLPRHPDAVISYIDDGLPTFMPDRDPHLATRRRELAGIVQQVGYYLGHAYGVGVNQYRSLGKVPNQVEPLLLAHGAAIDEYLADDVRNIDMPSFELYLSA